MDEGCLSPGLKAECFFILRHAGYPTWLLQEIEERKESLWFTDKRSFCQFFPFILQGTMILAELGDNERIELFARHFNVGWMATILKKEG